MNGEQKKMHNKKLFKSLQLFHIPLQLISVIILFSNEALYYGLPFINKEDTWQERNLHWFSSFGPQILSPGF